MLVHYFEFTDRVQHMMFRFFDPKHPLYTAEGAAKWGGSILAAYQDMDRIVGDTMSRSGRTRRSWSSPTTASPPSAAA